MMEKQRGFVLIQVLLVFAILIVVAAKLQYDQRIQIERTRQSLFLSQAQAWIESAEDIAKVGLYLDAKYSETDHLYEQWNTTDSVFPPDQGWLIAAQLNDLQGRFNLNWLSNDGANRAMAANAFKRLLTLLEYETDCADELLNWFDVDSGIDYDYGTNTPSYAPSFRQMADVSEVLLLNSVDYEMYKELAPYLSALPARSALNVNTAPVEILQSIAPYVDEGSAQGVVTDRDEAGFESVENFLNQTVFTENKDTEKYLSVLSVESNWFELYAEISNDNRVLKQRSVINRDNMEVTLTLRDQSVEESNPIPGDPKIDETLEVSEEQELE